MDSLWSPALHLCIPTLMHTYMQVKMPHNGEAVVIRIGMHTGPCVTGLVGTKLPKVRGRGREGEEGLIGPGWWVGGGRAHRPCVTGLMGWGGRRAPALPGWWGQSCPR